MYGTFVLTGAVHLDPNRRIPSYNNPLPSLKVLVWPPSNIDMIFSGDVVHISAHTCMVKFGSIVFELGLGELLTVYFLLYFLNYSQMLFIAQMKQNAENVLYL